MRDEQARRLKRPIHPMPDFVYQAMFARRLLEVYQQRPAYQQNDYIGWITQAKRQVTREQRLQQMLDELTAGDSYMRMAYNATTRGTSLPDQSEESAHEQSV